MAHTGWQATTLMKCVSVRPWLTYPGCDEPGGCHDLTLGNVYDCLGVEAGGAFVRIIDDSGRTSSTPQPLHRVLSGGVVNRRGG